jgi:hypothetical protein
MVRARTGTPPVVEEQAVQHAVVLLAHARAAEVEAVLVIDLG